ncbi:MAG: hypothetical protein H7Z13_14335 [Ferruginibacter sp.]|nr:hypothetical protein [Ferruginibacter sp.]
MKLPVIRHIQRTTTVDEINQTISVLENISAAPLLKDAELDVIGELISNLCGALEVHQMIAGGMPEKDACNSFMKKVLGSIDQ